MLDARMSMPLTRVIAVGITPVIQPLRIMDIRTPAPTVIRIELTDLIMAEVIMVHRPMDMAARTTADQ